jgi:hypothetical protein
MRVAKLDIQVSQRLNPTGILQRTGIHGVKTDAAPQREDLKGSVLSIDTIFRAVVQ